MDWKSRGLDVLKWSFTAQQRFEQLGEVGTQMVSAAIAEQGNCLLALGQLDAATSAYENYIKRATKQADIRGVAVGKGQLASVHMHQKRYADALQGYSEALHLFQQLNELATVATTWHQIGMVHRKTRNYSQAESAYRQSLVFKNQLNNHVGEAISLVELGNLYDDWNRPEQAVSFYRQAVDMYMQLEDFYHEGGARSNLANILVQLSRYDEARRELQRAIECKQAFGHAATPWITWGVLHHLEQISGNPQAAQAAWKQAVQLFLNYRRDGGENHEDSGRLCLSVGQAIKQGDTIKVKQMITNAISNPAQKNKNFLYKLQAILAGERDLALVEDERLPYDGAAELVLLLEQLEKKML